MDAMKQAELPEWATKTPEERLLGYELSVWDREYGGVQEIDISREEFLELKEHLARLRGIELSPGWEFDANRGEALTAATKGGMQ